MSIYGFNVGPSWPPQRTDYDYLLSLTYPGWAWECLRRSPSYCLAARVHGCLKSSIVPHCPNVQISRARSRWLPAEPWALSSFRPPPDCPAPSAPVLWLPEYSAPLITAEADLGGTIRERDFDVGKLPYLVHVHFSADGSQHVVLKSPTNHVTLIVTGPLITLQPVRLKFATTGFAGLEDHLKCLGALAHIVLGRARALRPDRPGETDRIELRNAIIALDGDHACASRRDIATVIYGASRVADEWGDRDAPLRHRIKRDIARGRRLRDGGYRQLLIASQLRAFGGRA